MTAWDDVPAHGGRTRPAGSGTVCQSQALGYCRGANGRGFATGGVMAWTRAAAVAEVKERGIMDAEVGGEEIALYWVDDTVYATHNVCTHAFARLSEGFLDGDCIECPIHQALFNVKTGEAVAPPAYTAVKTYPCRIEGDDVLVDI
jgi:nitrite reductase/ring-hydroxylating ferredoxin subunit